MLKKGRQKRRRKKWKKVFDLKTEKKANEKRKKKNWEKEKGEKEKQKLRNLHGTFAEPCGTLPVKEILKETIAEPCGTFAEPRGTFAEPCGTFGEPCGTSRNLAEPAQQGKSLRNLKEPCGTFGSESVLRTGSPSRNLRGTSRNLAEPSQ